MASDEKGISNLAKLLQPELMSVEELIQTLKERCIVVDHATDRRTLIELAYRFLMPLPQRKYRANRRGSIMTQNQEQRHAELKELGRFVTNPTWTETEDAEKEKLEKQYCRAVNHLGRDWHGDEWKHVVLILLETKYSVPQCIDKAKMSSDSHIGGFSSRATADRSADRLKPPPSAINYENKRIRLNSGGAQGTSQTNANSAIEAKTSSLNGCTEKRLPFVSTVAKDPVTSPTSTTPTKIKLSANSTGVFSASFTQHIEGTASVSPVKRPSASESDTEPKRFKPTAITWP